MAKTPFLNVKLEGQKDPLDPLVRAVTIEDNDRLVDEANLTFDDPDGNGANLFAPDKTLTVDLGWDGEHAVLFEGVIVDRHPVAGANGKRSLSVVARDLSHRMSQEVKASEFEPALLESIVRKVATRNNWTGDLAKITCDPNPQLTEKNELTKQVNETDYHYLQRLADRYGARAFVEYNDGKSRFYFISNRSLLESEPLGRLEYCRGLNSLIEFKYSSVAARSAKQYVANAVDPVSGEVKTAQGDAATAPPTAPLAGAAPVAPAAPTPAVGQPSDPDLANRVVVTDPTRVLGLRGEGRAVGTIALRAKGKVTIIGLAQWAEGDWYVSKATHTWSDTRTPDDVKADRKRASYETKFTATR
jgi:phage protein D